MYNYFRQEQEDGSFKVYQDRGKGFIRHIDDQHHAYLEWLKSNMPEDKPYIAPPPPEPEPEPSAMDRLTSSDNDLIKISARTIEDIIQDRIDAGKYVAQDVKDKIAERVALRAKI